MDYAFEQYTLEYGRLLEWAQAHEAGLAEGGRFRDKYTDKSVRALMPPQGSLSTPVHGSLKDSLLSDVAGNLASYLARKEKDERTSFPTSRNPSPDALTDTTDEFASSIDTDDYDALRDRLLKQARGSVMPLAFNRPDGATKNRNFSLFTRTERTGLFAVLYLLPAKHALCQSLNTPRDTLVRIDTGEIFKSKSPTAILVPLEIGENGWHVDKWLSAAQDARASVQSATLTREEGEYFLHVVFAFQTPDVYKPEAYLGVDKGILVSAAYALVDLQGKVVTLGHLNDELRALQIKHGHERERKQRNGQVVTRREWKQQAYDNILHNLANTLIDLAVQHKAQIVLEDLSIQVKGGRVVSRFRKLDHILTYKCPLVGAPKPRQIWAAYSSTICHKCGCQDKANRPDRDTFLCLACGHKDHADDNAAVNIARRALYRKADWTDYWEFHRSFANVA